MTPPQAYLSQDEDPPAAVSFRLSTLKKRADFLRASRAPRVATPGFVLQMRIRNPQEADGIRVGFTCSKKVGNAVARNRAKRRLREVARIVLPTSGNPDADYVLIGRAQVTATRPFNALVDDLRAAVKKLHGSAP